MALAREDAAALDRTDPLAGLRERFVIPDGPAGPVVYLDGNSLGALPRGVPARVAATVVEEWGHGLVSSWNVAGWFELPRRVGARIARLVGAEPDCVVAGDSTSVQLFKLLVAAARWRPDRRVLLTEPGGFPTDGYIAASVARMCGLEVRWCEPADLASGLADDVAVLAAAHVDYRTGRMLDAAALTAAAHGAGAVVCWDLAHSAGAVPVALDDWDADVAVGCGYKYLNGGPGAPAFGYVNRRWHDRLDQPLTGWWGHAEPFAMAARFRPAPGVAALQTGTAPILSMAALDAALDAFDGVDQAELRRKSLALTDHFVALVEAAVPEVEVVVPREHAERGSQVCLRHPEAYALVQALVARGVVGDYRGPDLARFGFAPLYVRYADVLTAVEQLRAVLDGGEHLRPEHQVRAAVT